MHFNCDQFFVQPLNSFIQQSRTLSTDISVSSILLTEMSSKSPGFIKRQPRCLYLNVAKTSQSQRMCVAISDASLHLSHPGLFTSPISTRYPFKRQCLVSSPVNILTWFLLRLSNSPALSAGFVRKPLACLCPCIDCQCSLLFPTCPVPDHSPRNLCRQTKCRFRSY
jgi:hypothetical protein